MTRSRRNHCVIERKAPRRTNTSVMPLATAISAILAGAPLAHAADESSATLDSVIVTAQKREENLQRVPLSIQAIGTEKLEQLHISDFNDYAKFLPSVSFTTIGPGQAAAYFRGVASGENNNHSGPLPSVGIYLDEQPITTTIGALDIHLYDIARVESLAGPQGTLYGASSQAGTLRIITNKPKVGKFEAGYDLEGNAVASGSPGYVAEGFINLPIGDTMAIRLVGWSEHEGGYIDNIANTRTFPTAGITMNNYAIAKDDYNDVDTAGARAALRIDLSDNWTITPTVMAQNQESNGIFGYDKNIGELEVSHYYPESVKDNWAQAALTVEGKIANFDVTYAGAYLKRKIEGHADYSDYSYFYDVLYNSVAYNDNGDLINPSQFITSEDRFTKQSHEFRITSPSDYAFRFIGGLFWQQQKHRIEQRYQIFDLDAATEVTGWPDTLWLTNQLRTDRDSALFGELSYDIGEKVTLTGGARYFRARNSLKGFYGFRAHPVLGEVSCQIPRVQFQGAPCVNLDKTVEESGYTPKVNLTYKHDNDHLYYFTYAEGFRPGGVNRNGSVPPYKADYLKSFELGWKTTTKDQRIRFNGALFIEKWEDFQFSFLPPAGSGLTVVLNAGEARIEGVEADITIAMSRNFTLSGGFSWIDAHLTQNYQPDSSEPPAAPKGSQLPISPEMKANLTGRYEFNLGRYESFAQASYVYQTDSWADLVQADRDALGVQKGYELFDVSTGIQAGSLTFEVFVKNLFDKRAEVYRYSECAICGADNGGIVNPQSYLVTAKPRTVGIKIGQKF
jgi:iron complex outermembrane recepter protein